MINFDSPGREFEAAFGKSVDTLTVEQLWWLVKFGKHIRGRCRSNAALNNYLSRNFKHAKFQQITKTAPDGRTYPGLSIKIGELEIHDNDTD